MLHVWEEYAVCFHEGNQNLFSCAWWAVGSCSQTTVDWGFPQSPITSQSKKACAWYLCLLGNVMQSVIHLQQLHNLECESRHFQTSLLYMFLIYGKETTTQTILNSLKFLDNQVFLSRFNLNSTPVYHYSSFFMTFLLKPKDSSFPSVISASELRAFFSTQQSNESKYLNEDCCNISQFC